MDNEPHRIQKRVVAFLFKNYFEKESEIELTMYVNEDIDHNQKNIY